MLHQPADATKLETVLPQAKDFAFVFLKHQPEPWSFSQLKTKNSYRSAGTIT